MKRETNKHPIGWKRKRTEALIAHFDNQTEDEAIAEADAAWKNSRVTFVRVPNELVAEVEAFVAKRVKKTGREGREARRRKTA